MQRPLRLVLILIQLLSITVARKILKAQRIVLFVQKQPSITAVIMFSYHLELLYVSLLHIPFIIFKMTVRDIAVNVKTKQNAKCRGQLVEPRIAMMRVSMQ